VIDSYERNAHTAVVEKIIEVLKVSKETPGAAPAIATNQHDQKKNNNIMTTTHVQELFKVNNFSSGMAVLSALNNSSVQRLRNLWTAVRKEHRDLVNHFELFMGMTDNFKNYRYGATSGLPHARHTSHRSYHPTTRFLEQQAALAEAAAGHQRHDARQPEDTADPLPRYTLPAPAR
jgi:hypothetical protein